MELLPIGAVVIYLAMQPAIVAAPGWEIITGTQECYDRIAAKPEWWIAEADHRREESGVHIECIKKVLEVPTS